jgi:transcription elongation factor GreA
VEDAQEREPADVGRRVEVRDERLERVVRVIRRRRDRLEQRLHQRAEVVGEIVGGEARAPLPGVGVDDRELDLGLVGVEVEEELVDLVHDLGGTGIGPIDLVHDEHHREPRLERLPENETRLRKRAFACIHQQEHAVDHGQTALDLPAEVGVPGRVDDVHLGVADLDGRVLGEDRDALLPLEVHRVEHTLRDLLVRAERAGLPEQRVDERRLPVVDVRHDGDVPKIVSRGGGVIARGQDRPGYRRYAGPVLSEKPEPMTRAQKAQLEAELSELEGPGRAEVVQAIATARGFGDLSENFEYHAAKNDQGMLEHRIRQIRDRLDRSVLVAETSSASGTIGVGSKAEIEDEHGERMSVEISSVGGVSPESPLGRALLGAEAGDEVDVHAPKGAWRARVLSVGV